MSVHGKPIPFKIIEALTRLLHVRVVISIHFIICTYYSSVYSEIWCLLVSNILRCVTTVLPKDAIDKKFDRNMYFK